MYVNSYVVNWNARGLDFNYNGSISVWAFSEDDARNKAIKLVSRYMVMPCSLISIKNIN